MRSVALSVVAVQISEILRGSVWEKVACQVPGLKLTVGRSRDQVLQRPILIGTLCGGFLLERRDYQGLPWGEKERLPTSKWRRERPRNSSRAIGSLHRDRSECKRPFKFSREEESASFEQFFGALSTRLGTGTATHSFRGFFRGISSRQKN